MYTIEVVATSVESCINAEAGGAGRIELCSALGAAGVTPSAGLIAAVLERVKIPVYVMIRPREGDFIYSGSELDVMIRDIDIAIQMGAHGLVFGMLTADGKIDERKTSQLVRRCGNLPVTFHRAFDLVTDKETALDSITSTGCKMILTSGGANNGLLGANVIHHLAGYADGKIEIMPGGGLTSDTIKEVFHEKISNYHLSGREPVISPLKSSLFDMDYAETSEQLIRKVVDMTENFFQRQN